MVAADGHTSIWSSGGARTPRARAPAAAEFVPRDSLPARVAPRNSVNADLDALATALYVEIDDTLAVHPHWCPQRPAVGLAPKRGDSELLTLAVMQALLGFTSEARFIRHA